MKPVFPSLLVGAVLMGAIVSAWAQTTPPVAASKEHAPMHHMGHGTRMDPAKMQAMHTKHLADLKTRLNITPAQEGAWAAFTDAMKPPARTTDRPDHAALDNLTTPERIDKMRELRAKHHADRETAMDQRDQAAKKLYAALSDAQKRMMDAEHARMGKTMERMHEGRHKGN